MLEDKRPARRVLAFKLGRCGSSWPPWVKNTTPSWCSAITRSSKLKKILDAPAGTCRPVRSSPHLLRAEKVESQRMEGDRINMNCEEIWFSKGPYLFQAGHFPAEQAAVEGTWTPVLLLPVGLTDRNQGRRTKQNSGGAG